MANDLRFLACVMAADAAAPHLSAIDVATVVRAVLDQVDSHGTDLATIHQLPGANVPARHETPVEDVTAGDAVWHDFDEHDRRFCFVAATEVEWERVTLFYEGDQAGRFKAGDKVLVANSSAEADRFNRGTWQSPLNELTPAGGDRSDDPTGWGGGRGAA